ncbi:MAG: hypothetical protein AAGH65_11640, partial [Pseudomonadota bacterium]
MNSLPPSAPSTRLKQNVLTAAITALLVGAPTAFAQVTEVVDPDADDISYVELDRIEVRANPLGGTALDSAQPVDVLAG